VSIPQRPLIFLATTFYLVFLGFSNNMDYLITNYHIKSYPLKHYINLKHYI
jgi:hypothetical protein